MGMLQHFSDIPYYALVRFGKWQDILDEPAPDEDLLYPTAVWHYARGNVRTAVAQLRNAIAIEDGLIYGEPPDWFYPVRHNLGAILLEAGRPAAAEKVYCADLARFPDNGWSLFGLAQSLRAQGKKEQAADVQSRFETAWQHADAEITASRF